MQSLEVSGAVRPIYGSLGVKRLINKYIELHGQQNIKICLYRVSKNILISNFMEIRPVEAELFHADRRTGLYLVHWRLSLRICG